MTQLQQVNLPSIDLIFETSWEVCNKIGGIYTVLSTKAKVLQNLYGDKVVFLGPDVWDDSHPSPYFREYKTLMRGAAKSLNGSLPHGITVRVGRWNIPGTPQVVLVKFDGIYARLDSYYGRAWERFGVDSLHAYGDYPDGCAFSIAASIVISALTNHLKASQRNVIAHFDEWTTAMGLLRLKDAMPAIATVFTTHATSIGRSICGNGKPLYDYFTGYNGDQMARELNMEAKHSLEKTAALQADCFTTVSEVTATECAQLLDKRPDVVTPNGFEPGFVPTRSAFKAARAAARKRMIEVASALTGRQFDEDNTFIIATSGRNEYRNKGIDLYIDALDRLRRRRNEGCRQIIAFILTPAWVDKARPELLDSLSDNDAGSRLPDDNRFLTHRLHNEESDAITCRLRDLGVNYGDEKVTFIFLPCYLDGNDGVMNMSYYDVVAGLDATVFPSYYEPWGYTPLESIAFGVPTISTDKAGFGQWILSRGVNGFSGSGCYVVERTDSNYDEAADKIAAAIVSLASADGKTMEKARLAALMTAADADWRLFINYYLKAYATAFLNRDRRYPLSAVDFSTDRTNNKKLN